MKSQIFLWFIIFIGKPCKLVQSASVGEDVNIKSEDLVVLKRRKRYALEGSRWSVNEVTYKITKYSDKLPKETVDKIIRKAFNIWAKASNLKFTQKKSGKVHIEIRFERGDHGDGAKFDGPGGQRAHAFFPGQHSSQLILHYFKDIKDRISQYFIQRVYSCIYILSKTYF